MKIRSIKPQEINKNLIILSEDLMNLAVNNLLRLNYDEKNKFALIKESEIILEYLKITGQQNLREVRKAIYESSLPNFGKEYENDWDVMYITEIEPIDEMYEPYYVFQEKYEGEIKHISTAY